MQRFLTWHRPASPTRPWTAFSEDDRIWYHAIRCHGGGWILLTGYRSGVDPAEEIGWYRTLLEAKIQADRHYENLTCAS